MRQRLLRETISERRVVQDFAVLHDATVAVCVVGVYSSRTSQLDVSDHQQVELCFLDGLNGWLLHHARFRERA